MTALSQKVCIALASACALWSAALLPVSALLTDDIQTQTQTTHPDHKTETLDFNGKQTRWDYDNLNRPSKESRADGATLTTTYTDSGQVASITLTPGAGLTTPARSQSYRYDAQDRLIEAISPEGSIAYSYDAAGNRSSHNVSSTTGTGSSTATTIDYDALYRPIKQTDVTGSGANQKLTETIWQYDGNSNKTEQITQGVKSLYSYDALNRLTAIEHGKANDATAAGLIARFS